MTASPPKADELEVSVFGPGYGECVLVHLGQEQWIVVDSCRDQRVKRQPALAYLDQIGADPESCVRVVLATHWHRDHVRGLTEVVARSVNADFWTSAAITSREALVLTGRIGRTDLTAQSPLRELHDVLQRLRVRSEGMGAPSIKTAAVGSLIYRRLRNGETDAEVFALSPHNEAVAQTRQRFAEAAGASPGLLVAPEIHPNHAAIALRVRFGSAVAILGSDLENGAPGGAWKAIAASSNDQGRAAIYKVPHHGSVTSHEPEVWNTLLQRKVVAATTPFRPERLPRADMAQAIVDLSGQSYLAAPPSRPKQRLRPRPTRALMLGSAVRVEEVEGRSGHVRMRCPSATGAAEQTVVDLRFPAIRLESILAPRRSPETR